MTTDRFIVRRRIEIDAAHRVPEHKSKCFNLHGHRYVIEAEVEGELYPTGEQQGMVLDFGFLKQFMMEEIHNQCDHKLILAARDPLLAIILKSKRANNWEDLPGFFVYTLDVVPTAENLARHWFSCLNARITTFLQSTGNVGHLRCVRVWETPNSLAIYPPGEHSC